MKIKLENREYDFNANGRLLLKYQENFNENLVIGLYKVAMEKDPLTCAKILYSGIEEDKPFEEWIDSFETPLFILEQMDTIYEYVTRSLEPTVKPNGGVEDEKKTTN